MIVSTKYLLELATKNNFACIDATYQLVYQGHPVILFCLVDKNKTFHPTCLAITTSENKQDYSFVIQSVNNKIKEIFDKDYVINYFLADAADSITLAIENIYPNAIRLSCWAHVERAVAARLSHVDEGEKILRDIYNIQLSYSPRNFEFNIQLFFDKWGLKNNNDLVDTDDSQVTKFLKYFKKEWVDSKHRNWYEGSALFFPSTNNGLESTNKSIKDSHTLREREHISRFMRSVNNIIEAWSVDRSSETDRIKNFEEIPLLTIELWDDADELVQSKPKIKFLCDYDIYFSLHYTVDESFELYYELIECELTNCQCFRTNYDLDQFLTLNNLVLRVKLNRLKWQLSTCTCKRYLKDFICEHIIAVSVKVKLTEIDYSFKDIVMKKKRGRTAKAKDWYVKQ
ncbi:unnamed protein product [Brachionus calyciflorus]|uniref:SWIM-type domain-containing protein n=1 Tax=Brachionus calyciflorus TaxID=104777 RepID=A0A814N4G4_9BILA|nr:unnamed protein product [Brachionus calyciflorus]